MISRDSNYSEIFEIFANQMGPDFLKQASDFVLPEGILDSNGERELEISLPEVMAAANRDKFYGVLDDDLTKMVADAHKGGGTKLDLGSNDKDLSKVETIVEQHKRIEDVARKMPKPKLAQLMVKLEKLASVMDEAGFVEDADAVEAVMKVMAERVFSDTIEGAKPEELSFGDGEETEVVSDQNQVKRQHQMEPAHIKANPQANRIRQMHQKATDLVNQHLERAGAPVSYGTDALMFALQEMGVGGYKNWNELFSQINEKAPVWASQKITPPEAPAINFSRQEASEADPDRMAPENLAAAERNQAGATPGRSVQRQQPAHHTGV